MFRGYALSTTHRKPEHIVTITSSDAAVESTSDRRIVSFRPVPAPVVTVFRLAWPFSHATAVTRAPSATSSRTSRSVSPT